MTTGWERLQHLGNELAWIIGPKHSGDMGWLFFAGFILLVIICRKAFGGVIPAALSLFGIAAVLALLGGINPSLPWILIGLAVVAWLLKGFSGVLRGAGVVLVAIIAIALAIYQNFMV